VAVFAVVLWQVAPQVWLDWTKDVLLWTTAALTVFSGLHYAYHTGKTLPEIGSKD